MFSSIFSIGKKNRQTTLSARRGVKLALIQLEERVNPAGGTLPDAPLFASQDGVLHVRFTAQSVTTEIDGTSFGDVYTYAAELISGEETPGTTDSKYIQPTLQVQRGDRLIIDYGNKLPKVEDAVLRADPNKLPSVSGVDLGPQGFAVLRVTKILPPEAENKELMLQAQQQFTQLWGTAETQAYISQLKSMMKAEILVPKPSAAKPKSEAQGA